MQIITKELTLIVISICQGTGAIQGIWLEMSQIQDIKLSSKSFRKMPNLRLLAFQSLNGNFKRINSVYLPKGLEFLPKKLRYLGWNGCPLESLPSTFCPEKLVELSMRYSNVQKLWHGVQVCKVHISIMYLCYSFAFDRN